MTGRGDPAVRLIVPSVEALANYVSALHGGWSPDNVSPEEGARRQLAHIATDPAGFIASLDDPTGSGPPIPLPDGSVVPRLPGIIRWIWTDEFVGSIGLRWQAGTSQLPPHVLGHIGFAVVPWSRRRGHARDALRLMLLEARSRGLDQVELTCSPDNTASRRVIEANGGQLIGTFSKDLRYGGGESLRWLIKLPE